MGRACNKHGEKRNAYRIWWGKPEGKRSLGRCRRRWEDTIRMYFREIGWCVVFWIALPEDRGGWKAIVNTLMNLWVP
jgi:hypothetical protein